MRAQTRDIQEGTIVGHGRAAARRIVLVITVVALLLAGAAAAAASGRNAVIQWEGVKPAGAPPTTRTAAAPAASAARAALPPSRVLNPAAITLDGDFVPLGGLLAGSGALTGHVVDRNLGPIVGGNVEWYVYGQDATASGFTVTDATGAYSCGGVPEAKGNGAIWALPSTRTWALGRSSASWTGTTSFDFTPGSAGVQLVAGGPYSEWDSAEVWLHGADGLSALNAGCTVSQTYASWSTSIAALWGLYDTAVVNFWTNQGLETPIDARVGPTVSDLTFVDAQHGWGVGRKGAIVATADGGLTWIRQDSGTTLDLSSVSFCDTLHGWALGSADVYGSDTQALLVTTNGGITWTPQDPNTDYPLHDVCAIDPSQAVAVGAYYFNGHAIVMRTTDGGSSWQQTLETTVTDPSYERTVLLSVDFADATHGWAVGEHDTLAGGQRGSVYVTTDGGATWTMQDAGTAGVMLGVEAIDSTHACAVGWSGVTRTTDGGSTWSNPGIGSKLRDVDFVDATHGWAVGDYMEFLRTTDGGATWADISSGWDVSAYDVVEFTDALHGWIGTSSARLTDTSNGGSSLRATGFRAEQADAQLLAVTSPRWASCRPGAAVKLRVHGYPAGWQLSVSGYPSYPESVVPKAYPVVTTSGASDQYVKLSVPKTAKPGYAYWYDVVHGDGLILRNLVQVCTLNATRTSVAKGTAIRASGVVPVQGHEGSTPGKGKRVYLWVHAGVKGVPTKWDPRSQGWLSLGYVKANGLGAYNTPKFKPLKTLTLVAQYAGDDWYRSAYTDVRAITVH